MFPFPPLKPVYVRSCEICVRLIPDGTTAYSCVPCFLEARPTLFCSRACRLEHDKRHHVPALPTEGGGQ